MRKSWIVLALVAFVGVLLAFLLFPAPDTGVDIEQSSRIEVGKRPVGEIRQPTKPLLNRPDGEEGPSNLRTPEGNPINPVAAEGVERRSQPDAVAAGRASSPWSLVRRTLLENKDEFSVEVLEKSAKIIADLRQARRDPDSVDFAALEQRQMELATQLRESEHGSNPSVTGALDRLDSVYAEYHQAIGE